MTTTGPVFSVVVPLFRTEAYLPSLLKSFDRQRPGKFALEFIFVNDGSDDASASIAEEWLSRTQWAGEVVHQENRGVAAARNSGIDAANGDWITFPDSDDFLSDAYFLNAATAIETSTPAPVLLSANVQRFQELQEVMRDNHPLRYKFKGTRAVADLRAQPTYIQTQTASAFFRLDLIRAADLRFIEGLRVAEDAVFASTYLLTAREPIVALLRHSIYYYRSRASADSASDTYRTNPDFYFGRFERGYIPLLRDASSEGSVPLWLSNIVLYDLSWMFPREMNLEKKATHLTATEREHVVELLRSVLHHVDPAAIIDYRITYISPEVRALMLALGGHELPSSGTVRVSKNVPGGFEISYLFAGARPFEVIKCADQTIQPIAAKTRRLDYFGQRVLAERIIRLPNRTDVSIRLDGAAQRLQFGPYYLGAIAASAASYPSPDSAAPAGTALWKQALVQLGVEVACWTKLPIHRAGISRRGSKLRESRYRNFIRNLAETPRARRKYAGAWLVMDKIGAAGDNGEYLYQYLAKTHQSDRPVYFVIKKDSPDWSRLRGLGFRLIAYRSIEHKVALLLSAVVASSQLDLEIVRPISPDFYARSSRPWRFVYLQHGVLQHDLAHWFNSKDIDLLTTASPDEHDSIVSEGSAYRLTTDSVALTGFPRHDVAVQLGDGRPFQSRSAIVIAPTWRTDLFAPKATFGAKRKLRAPFLQTEYGRNWMALLNHDVLRGLAETEGVDIVYLPHPNLRGLTDDVTFPPYVQVIDSAVDVNDLLSRARVTITDYSSIFFEAALAKSRIVYFQFDQQEYLNGGHTYLPGYWDYEAHGFGPIATDVDATAQWIHRAYSSSDSLWPEVYSERVQRTLPAVDGSSAERIVNLIAAKFENDSPADASPHDIPSHDA